MSDQLADIYIVIERTKRSDPGAFEMKIGSDGLPAGFIDSDLSRRSAAYIAACTELAVPEYARLHGLVRA